MSDFNKPATTDSYTNVLAYLKATIADLALGLDPANTTATNVPTNAVRWNSANNRFEKYDGTTWNVLSATFAFTNITASGTVTLSGGTANGVPYLNASKQLVSGSALTFDGTNFGVGTATPTVATGAGIQAKNATFASFRATAGAGTGTDFSQDSSGNGYVFNRDNAAVIFGTNNAEQMRLTSTGLGIGTSSPFSKLSVNGTIGSGNAITSAALFYQSGTNLYIENTDDTGTAGNSQIRFRVRTYGSPITAATIDAAGNLGLGVTPSAWRTVYKALQTNGGSVYGFTSNDRIGMVQNGYVDSSSLAWTYVATAAASRYDQIGGVHAWYNAPSGTAGNAISFIQAMTLDASGNLGVGTTSPSVKLHVSTSGSGIQEPIWLNNAQAVGAGVGARLVFTGTTSNNGLAAIDGAFAGATTADGGYMVFNTRAVTTGALTERMRLDAAGNLGLGVTPSAWGTFTVSQVKNAAVMGLGTEAHFAGNTYYNAGYKRISSGYAARYSMNDVAGGVHAWFTAGTGAADSGISFTQAMTLFTSGGLSLGNTTDPGASNLSVTGTVADGTATLRPLVAGTSQATTSGTSKTFGSIPSWVKRITMMLSGVSLSGSANPRFRLGTSGGLATSGYTSFTNVIQNSTVVASSTAGFDTNGASSTSTTYSGIVTFALLDATNNIWVANGVLAMAGAVSQTVFSGAVTLSGALTQIALTSTNGTDTFDAGSVNILYE